MRSYRALLAALLAVLLLPATASARSHLASVHVKSCETGSDPSDRSGTYQAWMHAVPGTARMAVRFELVAHYPGHRPQRVQNRRLSVWHHSRLGVTHYGYSQTIKQLDQGASYRTVVRFRWYDASDNVIKRAKRVSGACVQDGALPNLLVSGVSIARGPKPGTRVYYVTVANRGEGDAGSFSTTLIADGAVVDSRTIDSLAAGATQTIQMDGPPCQRLRAVADSGDEVAETNEDDNSFRARC